MMENRFARWLGVAGEKYALFLKFLAGGIFITVLQVALLYLFTRWFSLWYLLSAQLSFVIAFLVSFVIYRDWVFPGGEKAGAHQFVLYSIFTVVMFLANGAGMYLLVDLAGVWYLLAQFIVKAVLSIASYFLYNSVIFNR